MVSHYDEEVLWRVRALLKRAHEAEIGDRNPKAADALGAQAANLLAGVIHRTAKVIELKGQK